MTDFSSPSRRCVRRGLFFLVLIALALGLWHWLPSAPRARLHGRKDLVWLSPDGSELITLDHGEKEPLLPLIRWDAQSGREKRRFQPDPLLVEAHEFGLFEVCHATGSVVAKWKDQLWLLNRTTGKEHFISWPSLQNWRFSTSGDVLAVANMDSVMLVDAASGAELGRCGQLPKPNLVHVSRQVVVIRELDRSIFLWQPGVKTKARQVSEAGSAWVSPDGKTLATRTLQKTGEHADALQLWDLPSGQPRVRIEHNLPLPDNRPVWQTPFLVDFPAPKPYVFG